MATPQDPNQPNRGQNILQGMKTGVEGFKYLFYIGLLSGATYLVMKTPSCKRDTAVSQGSDTTVPASKKRLPAASYFNGFPVENDTIPVYELVKATTTRLGVDFTVNSHFDGDLFLQYGFADDAFINKEFDREEIVLPDGRKGVIIKMLQPLQMTILTKHIMGGDETTLSAEESSNPLEYIVNEISKAGVSDEAEALAKKEGVTSAINRGIQQFYTQHLTSNPGFHLQCVMRKALGVALSGEKILGKEFTYVKLDFPINLNGKIYYPTIDSDGNFDSRMGSEKVPVLLD